MSLIQITPDTHNILLDLAYATPNNFCGHQIYKFPLCFLHRDAVPLLEKAIDLAKEHQLRLKIFDTFRPQAAQEALWEIVPNPMYVAPPSSGSNHTRGVAIDLTLVDLQGHELDMGTPFDTLEATSHHGTLGFSKEVSKNRYLLLGIMMSAGWDLYMNEWWHYQLFNAKKYPLIQDDYGIMS